MDSIVRFEQFGLAFNKKKIFQNFNLAIPNLGLTVLLGPSGTGKSTLLRTLAQLTQNHPSIQLEGQCICTPNPSDKSSAPQLLQQKSKLLVSTVFENLITQLPNRASLTREAQKVFIDSLLQKFGQSALIGKLEAQVIDLPLGLQRIVSILGMYVSNPCLMMLDEPTANLSDTEAESLLALVQQMSKSIPVLMISHHIAQTERYADYVGLIADGELKEFSQKDTFFTNPQNAITQQFIATGSCPEYGVGVSYVEPILEAVPTTIALEVELNNAYHEGPDGFVWLYRNRLAGTPQPGIFHDTNTDLSALKAVGIRLLLTLTERPYDASLANRYGIKLKHEPIVDMKAPTIEQMLNICSIIDEHIALNQPVAVHCKAGLGRTGTVLAAYWLWVQRGLGEQKEALSRIRKLQARMIQSDVQELFLKDFAEHLSHQFTSNTHPTFTQ